MNVREIRVWVEDEKREGIILKIDDDSVVVEFDDGSQAICPHEAISVVYEEYEV